MGLDMTLKARQYSDVAGQGIWEPKARKLAETKIKLIDLLAGPKSEYVD
jgi:hypothetical protein